MGFIRNFLAWMSVPVLCILALPFFIVRPFNPDNNRLLAIAIAKTGRAILGMERPVDGLENMPQDRPVVAICNHQYNDDLFVVGDLVAPRTVTVGKSSLVWVPFFGWAFWLGGNVILNRARSRKAIAVMQATSEAITRENKSLWVFVEGTRSKGRGLQKFKKGAFFAAVAAGAPIVMVCAAEYRNNVMGRLGRREPVRMRILPPVETTGLTTDDVPALIARCHKEMAAVIAELSQA